MQRPFNSRTSGPLTFNLVPGKRQCHVSVLGSGAPLKAALPAHCLRTVEDTVEVQQSGPTFADPPLPALQPRFGRQ